MHGISVGLPPSFYGTLSPCDTLLEPVDPYLSEYIESYSTVVIFQGRNIIVEYSQFSVSINLIAIDIKTRDNSKFPRHKLKYYLCIDLNIHQSIAKFKLII